jgi:hypothetical protein
MRIFAHIDFPIAVPETGSGILNDWFHRLLLGEQKARPAVSEQEWRSWLKFVEWHGLSSLVFT